MMSTPKLPSLPLPQDHPPDLPLLAPLEDFSFIRKLDEVVIKDDVGKKVKTKEKKKMKKKEEKQDNMDEAEEDEKEGKVTCSVLSRSEKKSRKAMLKLGLQPVPGVQLVTFKKNENVLVISEPDVFKSPSSETHVIFGEVKIQDPSSMKLVQEQLTKDLFPSHGESSDRTAQEQDHDELVLDPRDIELVMIQTGLTWTQAARALRDADNDIITAIMEHINL